MIIIPDTLNRKQRKARKDHICNYCGGVIHKGEIYDWAKLSYEGELYEWKTHLECSDIASALWNYIDPYDGMTEDDFHNGCREFCEAFICPGCEHADKDTYDDTVCKLDKPYCLDKITEKLKHYDFERVPARDGDWMRVWKLFPTDKSLVSIVRGMDGICLK